MTPGSERSSAASKSEAAEPIASEPAGIPAEQVFESLRRKARRLTLEPGVYQFLDAEGAALYIGKAASLRRRVASYFVDTPRSPRLTAMLRHARKLEITATRSEGEALLLENQLIKSLKPRYNVLLRDDKSYPYIRLDLREPTPRVVFHRGARGDGARYFGPFASAGAVREALGIIHRLFRLRSCEDSVFANRSRPCLQYQIERCSAPCVGYIPPAEYRAGVERAALFLEGRSNELAAGLAAEMAEASQELSFERAGQLRDLIAALRRVQARQYVDGDRADLDVLGCAVQAGHAAIVVLSFRGGANLGTRTFLPRTHGETEAREILGAFVTQHYLGERAPREIVLATAIEDQSLIEQALRSDSGHPVQLKDSVRGDRAGYLDLAQRNASLALASELQGERMRSFRLKSLTELLSLPAEPERIECFDISHTAGEATVASCVVFSPAGAVRSQYRRYNIEGETAGDDYGAMRQALTRRFKRVAKDGVIPDLLLIDGGRGQLKQATDVLTELDLASIAVIGVAKGPARKPGAEQLVLPDGRKLAPGPASPGLQLIQQIRDEAHRFAITGHRGRRAKPRERSSLESIAGVGSRRRQTLLKHFGGLQGLKRASLEEIASVGGIGPAMASRIWASLHGAENA